VLAGHLISDEPLTLGPGYDALHWALDPQRSVVAIVALGTLRVIGTGAVLGGGGAGGLFIPLVIEGALVGRAIGGVFDAQNPTLFPVVGMAAFLGAGYHVPLAAVVFVAEVTGRPGFVVPGLIAAVVAQLVVGRASVASYQAAGRTGHVESRLLLPLSSVVDTEARSVPSDATLDELFWQHLVAGRQHSVAVVDDGVYVGIVGPDQASTIERTEWGTTTVAEVMRTDIPAASPTWPLRQALEVMEDAGTDRLAVCTDQGFIGVIVAADIVRLDEILRTDEP
jgi:CBS domain-containing protein